MAEAYMIKMPQRSDHDRGRGRDLRKKVRDRLARGDIVAAIETDKAIMDVEMLRDGYLSGPLVAVYSVVPVGEASGYFVIHLTTRLFN
ncbi:MAG: hypothetical protein H0V62_15250 [Gammaproteobacteria bacterium]|nr:hypothetical protein [Gammaproteobacteria bacterium]